MQLLDGKVYLDWCDSKYMILLGPVKIKVCPLFNSFASTKEAVHRSDYWNLFLTTVSFQKKIYAHISNHSQNFWKTYWPNLNDKMKNETPLFSLKNIRVQPACFSSPYDVIMLESYWWISFVVKILHALQKSSEHSISSRARETACCHEECFHC